MPLVSMRQLLDHAAEHNYGHPAFNVSNIEQIHAVFRAAQATESPVIIQFSSSARKYFNDYFIKNIIGGIAEEYPQIPFAVHQDHGSSFEVCMSAISSGFSSVMMDGSLEADGKTPASFEYNAGVTRKVVDTAHAMGISVEGEIGVIGSLETGAGEAEDGHGFEGTLSKEKLLTDPEEAYEFVKATKLDALAVAIGTSHGAYKFTRKPEGDILAIDRIREIYERIPGVHIVMHGSSSVPQYLQDEINQFGGEIKQTFGVPMEEIQTGIKNGVRKVNIDTDLRMAVTASLRRFMAENPANFDPRAYLGQASKDMQKVCETRYQEFGCAGKNQTIKPKTLREMANFYK